MIFKYFIVTFTVFLDQFTRWSYRNSMLDNSIRNIIWCIDDQSEHLNLKPFKDGDVGIAGYIPKLDSVSPYCLQNGFGESCDLRPMIQYIWRTLRPSCLRLLKMCFCHISRSKCMPRYLAPWTCGSWVINFHWWISFFTHGKFYVCWFGLVGIYSSFLKPVLDLVVVDLDVPWCRYWVSVWCKACCIISKCSHGY